MPKEMQSVSGLSAVHLSAKMSPRFDHVKSLLRSPTGCKIPAATDGGGFTTPAHEDPSLALSRVKKELGRRADLSHLSNNQSTYSSHIPGMPRKQNKNGQGKREHPCTWSPRYN